MSDRGEERHHRRSASIREDREVLGDGEARFRKLSVKRRNSMSGKNPEESVPPEKRDKGKSVRGSGAYRLPR